MCFVCTGNPTYDRLYNIFLDKGAKINMKSLVVYFSCSGVTRGVARKLSNITNSDLFEIIPEETYTETDLDWTNKNSRSSVEMNDNDSRPKIKNKIENINDYDVIYLGFPIWWYVAPKIINTFLEQYDFSGKTIAPFCTSGSSGLGNTIQELKPSCSESTNWIDGKRFSSNVSDDEIGTWINILKIQNCIAN